MSESETLANPMRNTDAKSNFGIKGWVIVIYAMLCYTYVMTLENGLNFIIPAIAGMYGLDPTALFSMSSIGLWAGCISLAIVGYISRRKGAKAALLIGLFPSIIAIIIWGSAKSVGVYGLGVIMFNMSQVAFLSVGIGALAANWFPTKKGLFMGWATMGIVLASIVSNMVLNPMITNLGVSSAMKIVAGFGLLLSLFTIFFVKKNPEEANAYPDNNKSMSMEDVRKLNALGEAYRQTSPWNSYKKCLLSPAVWAVGLINGLLLLVVRGVMSQIIMAMVSFGYEMNFAAKIMASTALLAFLFSYLGGVVDQKLGTKNAVSICCIGTSLACVVFALLGSNIVALFIALVGFGYSSSAGNNYIVSLATEIFGRYDFDIPWSIILIIFNLVSGLGFTLMSAVGSKYGYAAAYWICAGIAGIAAIISLVYKGRFEGRKTIDQAEIDAAYTKLMAE